MRFESTVTFSQFSAFINDSAVAVKPPARSKTLSLTTIFSEALRSTAIPSLIINRLFSMAILLWSCLPKRSISGQTAITGLPHSTKRLRRMVRSFTGPDSYQPRASSETRIAGIGILKNVLFSITDLPRVVSVCRGSESSRNSCRKSRPLVCESHSPRPNLRPNIHREETTAAGQR